MADTYRTHEEIERFIHEWEQCALPPERWTHSAHLTVALWYLTRYPKEDATRRIRSGIQAYNASRGLLSTPSGGYHETITLFYIGVVGKFLREVNPASTLPELLDGLRQHYGHKKLLTQYYSRPLLISREARTSWVVPDLCPLDWDAP